MPKFECAKCGDTQVTLNAASGVIPVYNRKTKEWSLVLIKSLDSRSKAAKYGLMPPVTFNSVWGYKSSAGNRMVTVDGRGGRGGWKKGPGMGPYFPGQCIDCPGVTKKQGAACGEWRDVVHADCIAGFHAAAAAGGGGQKSRYVMMWRGMMLYRCMLFEISGFMLVGR
jgi:hypothetical protein